MITDKTICPICDRLLDLECTYYNPSISNDQFIYVECFHGQIELKLPHYRITISDKYRTVESLCLPRVYKIENFCESYYLQINDVSQYFYETEYKVSTWNKEFEEYETKLTSDAYFDLKHYKEILALL